MGPAGNPRVHLLNLTAWHAKEGLSGFGPSNKYSGDGVHPLAARSEQLGGFLATAITQQIDAPGEQ